MISKELLSEVLEKKAISKIEYDKLRNIVEYQQLERYWEGINIYELAFKCKEWALNKEYYFSIYSFNFSGNTEQEHRIRLLKNNDIVYYGNDSCLENEQEAIFKACQWILDNKGTN